jgi:hypothetical protein
MLYFVGKKSNNKKAAVPWLQISDNPIAFIQAQYIPKGVHIREPSKMQSADVRRLCAFLHHRQTLGQRVLEFKNVLPTHRRGKALRDADKSHTQDTDNEVSRLSQTAKHIQLVSEE